MRNEIIVFKKNIRNPFSFVDLDTVPSEWLEQVGTETAARIWADIICYVEYRPMKQFFRFENGKTVFTERGAEVALEVIDEILFENVEPEEFGTLCASAVLEAVSGEFRVRKSFFPVLNELEDSCPKTIMEAFGKEGTSEYLTYLYCRWDEFRNRMRKNFRLCFAVREILPDGSYRVTLTKNALKFFKSILKEAV